MPTPENLLIGKVIARAWADPPFKEALLRDPKATLRAAGIEIPESLQDREVVMVADTKETAHFVLPMAPSDDGIEDYPDWLLGPAGSLCRQAADHDE